MFISERGLTKKKNYLSMIFRKVDVYTTVIPSILNLKFKEAVWSLRIGLLNCIVGTSIGYCLHGGVLMNDKGNLNE